MSGLNGQQVAGLSLGLPVASVVDGNFSGNSVDDITTVRPAGGQFQWTTFDRGSGTWLPPVAFGISATDFTLTGDYDGDGLDDYSIWRPSATPGASKFSIRRSATPAVPIDILMGASGDYPVGNARTH